jgi:ketosteroid isomerase-like protein
MRSANEQSAHDTIVAQLQAAMKRWYKGDPSAYGELFADDLTYFAPVTGGRLQGISALKDLFAPIEGKINVPRFEMLNPKLQLLGDVGVLTYHLDEYASDGPASTRWNATEVYHRIGEQWRIMHAHWSARPNPQ